MRRIVVFFTLLALAMPFAAGAAMRASSDGTLSVRDLDGFVFVSARGAVIGGCQQCVLVLDERFGADEITPVVSGARGVDIDDDGAKERFVGKDLRWRVIGGSFRMKVRKAVDVDLSVVGRGVVQIRGTNGTFVVNGGETVQVTEEPTTFALRAVTSLTP